MRSSVVSRGLRIAWGSEVRGLPRHVWLLEGAALFRRPPKNTKPRKLDGEQEAHLIALACSAPPDGRGKWSIRLLAERFVELDCGEDISRELVRRTLKNRRTLKKVG